MTPEEFVAAVTKYMFESAVEGTLSQLQNPTGRSPGKVRLESSAWYRQLSEPDRAQVRRVAARAAHGALFGFLAVLDGVRKITDKGEFVLILRDGEKEWTLSGREPLHDLFNADAEMMKTWS